MLGKWYLIDRAKTAKKGGAGLVIMFFGGGYILLLLAGVMLVGIAVAIGLCRQAL